MSDDDLDQDKMAAEGAAAMAEQDDDTQDDIDALLAGVDEPVPAKPAAERVDLDEFDPAARNQRSAGAPDIDVILDIPVRISMEVGNTEITIRNLLQLNQGSVIELDRL